ncbi:hypothetical protein M1512_00015 [Patescibacteria group bacterium]|nr:hypothetical protein [Patescibacteria group bacterium]
MKLWTYTSTISWLVVSYWRRTRLGLSTKDKTTQAKHPIRESWSISYPEDIKEVLRLEHESLNPLLLKRQIDKLTVRIMKI